MECGGLVDPEKVANFHELKRTSTGNHDTIAGPD
jgi:hypothetical protein